MLKTLLKKAISSFLAVLLMLALITTASADRVYTGEGFVIPASRIGGARPDLREPDDPTETPPEATPEPDAEIEAGTQVTPEALDENVEGLVVVDGEEKTEDTNSTEQTEVRTNGVDDNSGTQNVEIQDEIIEPETVDEKIDITVIEDNESEQFESSIENEVIYLKDDEGNTILDDNGNPISYIAVDTDDAEEELKITYQKDENGKLILDDAGEPIPIVPEGMEIPVRFERDAFGQLILDENGNPICLETVGAGSQKVMDIYDMLDPNRSVSMYFYYFGKSSCWLGDPVQMIAVPKGYDNVPYSFQWQYSTDNETWFDCEGETEKAMTVEMTMENCMNWWRVQIILDIPEE